MPASPLYFFPEKTIQTEQEVKNSRFITTIGRAQNRDAAAVFIDSIRKTHANANHNCWAFIAGNPNNTIDLGSNDDGEPQGTAGKPMLTVLQHKNIGQVAAVVTRYFGGIKLGTGGLVRAYSGSISQAIEKLPLKPFFEIKKARILLTYPDESCVRRLLEKSNITISDLDYSENINMIIEVPDFLSHILSRQIIDQTRGRAAIIWENED
jgi:uncharacterized YigZ family protein